MKKKVFLKNRTNFIILSFSGSHNSRRPSVCWKPLARINGRVRVESRSIQTTTIPKETGRGTCDSRNSISRKYRIKIVIDPIILPFHTQIKPFLVISLRPNKKSSKYPIKQILSFSLICSRLFVPTSIPDNLLFDLNIFGEFLSLRSVFLMLLGVVQKLRVEILFFKMKQFHYQRLKSLQNSFLHENVKSPPYMEWRVFKHDIIIFSLNSNIQKVVFSKNSEYHY